jgi:hypothetical protein
MAVFTTAGCVGGYEMKKMRVNGDEAIEVGRDLC